LSYAKDEFERYLTLGVREVFMKELISREIRPQIPNIEFSQCPNCLTYFGFTGLAKCPACNKQYLYLPDVDDEVRIFIS
jgi:hypothetical protein